MKKEVSRCSGILFGSMMLLAPVAWADNSYWYYNGERVSPADSRAVLGGETAPVAVPSDKLFGYLEQGQWTQRKQDYLSGKAGLDKEGFIQPVDSGVSVMTALLQNGGARDRSGRQHTVPDEERALPFWRDIEVADFADMLPGLSGR